MTHIKQLMRKLSATLSSVRSTNGKTKHLKRSAYTVSIPQYVMHPDVLDFCRGSELSKLNSLHDEKAIARLMLAGIDDSLVSELTSFGNSSCSDGLLLSNHFSQFNVVVTEKRNITRNI